MSKKNSHLQNIGLQHVVKIGRKEFIITKIEKENNIPQTVILTDNKSREFFLIRDPENKEPIYWLRDKESRRLKTTFRRKGRPYVVAIIDTQLKDLTYIGV